MDEEIFDRWVAPRKAGVETVKVPPWRRVAAQECITNDGHPLRRKEKKDNGFVVEMILIKKCFFL